MSREMTSHRRPCRPTSCRRKAPAVSASFLKINNTTNAKATAQTRTFIGPDFFLHGIKRAKLRRREACTRAESRGVAGAGFVRLQSRFTGRGRLLPGGSNHAPLPEPQSKTQRRNPPQTCLAPRVPADQAPIATPVFTQPLTAKLLRVAVYIRGKAGEEPHRSISTRSTRTAPVCRCSTARKEGSDRRAVSCRCTMSRRA